MNQTKVLFLCIHNAARSQMAEAYLKKFGGGKFFVESAGLEAGKLNPLAVEVMKEDGIDISNNRTNDVFEFFKEGRIYHYVVTVCDEGSAAKCPIFPGVFKKINWSFADPSALTGTQEEKLSATRQVRNKIKDAVLSLINELS
ncbi:MAG: arsenate reductase ArsC [Bacteroidia bacterium]